LPDVTAEAEQRRRDRRHRPRLRSRLLPRRPTWERRRPAPKPDSAPRVRTSVPRCCRSPQAAEDPISRHWLGPGARNIHETGVSPSRNCAAYALSNSPASAHVNTQRSTAPAR
jgi:hypothetical protein